MLLSELSSPGSTKSRLRVGRGQGRRGKTCGRGHKGQKARSGGARRHFNGGQTPLYRQLPKMGFISRKALLTARLRLGELNRLNVDASTPVTIDLLRDKGMIQKHIKYVKIYLSGDAPKAKYQFDTEILLTKGVKKELEAMG